MIKEIKKEYSTLTAAHLETHEKELELLEAKSEATLHLYKEQTKKEHEAWLETIRTLKFENKYLAGIIEQLISRTKDDVRPKRYPHQSQF